MLSAERAELLPGDPDPADRNELAHTTATALVTGGRAGADDADLQRRLVHLVDVEGLDLLAQLWSASPAETLPGALWRLCLLRGWTRRDPHMLAERYRLGCSRAAVYAVVAGVVSPAGPHERRERPEGVVDGAAG